MSAFVEKTPDWYYVGQLTTAMAVLDNEVAKDVRRRIKKEVLDPLAVKVKARGTAMGRIDGKAARSVKTRGGTNPAIIGGANGHKDRVVFFGSEFGAHQDPGRKKRYIGRVGKTYRGIIKRHVNHQFRPWVKGQGYWFHPEIEDNMERVTREMIDMVEDTIERELF